MRRRIAAALAVLICVFGLAAGMGKCAAYAKDDASGNNSFYGTLELLKQEDDNYVVQVTVENNGKDFSGSVQLVFRAVYDNTAYNTEITLPAQGKKQFTVTVTERAVDTARDSCAMNFLDEKGKVLQTINFKNVFGSLMSGVTVGILSDDYDSLRFMDAGGRDFYIRGDSYPMQLVELNRDNLRAYLDGLHFLVIDQFNVSSLSREDIEAIQTWVKSGGWLLVGTGAYAEQTLSGFDEDFLNLSLMEIREPGEENSLYANAQRYQHYYSYTEADIDFTNMAIAEMDFNQMGYGFESSQNPAIVNSSYGGGAVAVYFFSFGDPELQKLDDYVIEAMYEEVMYQSDSYQSIGGRADIEYVGQRALAGIDSENTNVDFSWLKVLIVFYVVLVGPVLYLILRRCRRSEWYWVGVPVLGLAFIAAVFAFGHGSRVSGTKVYSVTVQQVDSTRMDTYFLAYHSGTRPWDMGLRDDYTVGGPGLSGYYGRNYYGGTSDYTYTVTNGSRGMSIGLKPHENFESGYLYAGGRTEKKGALTGEHIRENSTYMGSFDGTVTNDTGYDLAYMAVWHDAHLMVYADVKAGETISLQRDSRCVYENMAADAPSDMMYDILYRYNYSKKTDYRPDDMSALLIGLCAARDAQPLTQEYVLVAGVVRDYDKAVITKCNETAYGCLYTYVKMEVE